MSSIIFARPRYDYDSYVDLYALIKLSGFPLVYFDEVDPESDNCYILTLVNGECQHGWNAPRARIILWDLEWRIEGGYSAVPVVPGVSEVWASDAWYARAVAARYVPMGSHPGLRLNEDRSPVTRFDAAFLGYMIPRREQMRVWLTERGVRLSPRGAWGGERHDVLNESACYLHVHQFADAPGMPALRLVVAAAYSLPFISEEVADPGIFGYTHFMRSRYGTQMADFVKMWTCAEDRTHLADYGLALHDLLCRDLTFRKSVEKAV